MLADMALMSQYKVVEHEKSLFLSWSAVCLLSAAGLFGSNPSDTCRYDLTNAMQIC